MAKNTSRIVALFTLWLASTLGYAAEDPGQLNVNSCPYVLNMDGATPVYVADPYWLDIHNLNNQQIANSGAAIGGLNSNITSDVSGTGKFLFYNSALNPVPAGATVLFQTIPTITVAVETGREYIFSYYVANLNTTNNAQIQPFINDVSLGGAVSVPGVGVWGKLSYKWNAGASTSALLRLNFQNPVAPSGAGRDFGLDEISLCPSYADLVTVKTLVSGNPTPHVGAKVSFRITVTNNGPEDATNVVLTDSLPEGLTATSGNGVVSTGSYNATSGLWEIGSLANGASATLTLVGIVNDDQSSKMITNRTSAATTPNQFDPTTIGDLLAARVSVMPIITVPLGGITWLFILTLLLVLVANRYVNATRWH